MKGWPMYNDIQQRRDLGFGKSQIDHQLGLNYRTVSRYWDMTAEEFERTILTRKRKQSLELYEGIILDWLKQQRMISILVSRPASHAAKCNN